MNSPHLRLAAASLSAVLIAYSSQAAADDVNQLRETTVNLLNLLVQQGVITRDKADALIKQSQQAPAPQSPATAESKPAAPAAAAATPAGSAAQTAPGSAAANAASAKPPVSAEAKPAAPAAGAAGVATAAQPAASGANASAASATAPATTATTTTTKKDAPAGTEASTAPAGVPASGAAAPAAAADAAAQAPKTVHVQYVPEFVKEQIRNEIKQEVLDQAHNEKWGDPETIPEWLGRLVWSGDFRMRQETDLFPSTSGQPNLTPLYLSNPPWAYNLSDTAETRNRLRLRARLGVQARINDEFSAGVRIATGATGLGSSPVSENVTLGNYDARSSIGLDRAYVRYKPVSWFTATGGKFANPFFAPTDLIWSDTISPEGIAVKLTHEFSDSFDVILVSGAFPIQLQDFSSSSSSTTTSNPASKWMYGYQTGFDWQFADRDDLKFTAALFDFRHVEGILDPNTPTTGGPDTAFDWSAASFRQRGNQVFDIHGPYDQLANSNNYVIGLLSKFRELNFSTRIDIANFDPLHIIVDADYVRNLAFNPDEITNRTRVVHATSGYDPLSAQVVGYQFKLTVGDSKLRQRWDWQSFVGYRNVERDATLDAFTDSDFHLGGTDARGYFLGGKLGVANSTFVTLRWMSADTISLPGPLNVDVLQLDLNTSF